MPAGDESPLNIRLLGHPGVGKTDIGRLIAGMLHRCGAILRDDFIEVNTGDLEDEHLGSGTNERLRQKCSEANDAVLFWDEFHNSRPAGKDDLYKKQLHTEMCRLITDPARRVVWVVAGYPEQMDALFDACDPGLARRFPVRIVITPFDHMQLARVVLHALKRRGMSAGFTADEGAEVLSVLPLAFVQVQNGIPSFSPPVGKL